jgi:uncharacterized protein involved in exopolysaccharide biosynthesis
MEERALDGTEKGERRRPEHFREEDVVDIGAYFTIIRKNWWKILGLSLLVGILTLSVLFLLPNRYRARAVIAPSGEEQKTLPAIGALASSFGIQLGGPSKIEDLESLFKSNDLTARVFTRHSHWAVLLGDRYDPATGMVKQGTFDFLRGEERKSTSPGKWDAVRAVDKMMTVKTSPKSGFLTLSFVSTSPETSAAILKDYLDEAKNRLQEEALDRAVKNKRFIEEQIGKTVDAWTRDRLYLLYGQEVEREMMARNREQFGFRVIDSPWILDRKSEPRRGLAALVVTLFSGLMFSIYFIARDRPRQQRDRRDGT